MEKKGVKGLVQDKDRRFGKKFVKGESAAARTKNEGEGNHKLSTK